MWDSKVFTWMQLAGKTKDEGMIMILKEIQRVRKPIVQEILKRYINQCSKRQTIAFIQWRLYYCQNRKIGASCQVEDEKIKQLIDINFQSMKMDYKRSIESLKLKDNAFKIGY